MFSKAWCYLAQFLIDNIASENLIEGHLNTHKKLFLSCNDLEKALKNKLTISSQII